MGTYTATIQQLYVAYFNRPADPLGLAYWEGAVAKANGSTAAVSAAFAASAEYQASYAGMDNAHVVAQVYTNLFGHGPYPAGLNFWLQALLNKQMTIDNVVTQVASGAQGNDLAIFNSKAAAATAFTGALDTAQRVLSYDGAAANLLGKMFIANVVDAASLKALTAPTTLSQIIDSMSGGPPYWKFNTVPVGAVFTPDPTAPAGVLDASLVSKSYAIIDLAAGSTVTNVGTQSLIAHGNLSATALGYVSNKTYAGNLAVLEAKDGGTVSAYADALTLTVRASADATVGATVTGDVQSLTATLINGLNTDASPAFERLASVTLAASASELKGLKSLSLSGNGSAFVSNADGAKLTAIDARGLVGTDVPGSDLTGLTYVSHNSAAETIKLGTGADHLTLWASTYDHMDTVAGLHLVVAPDGASLAFGSDTLKVSSIGSGVKVFTTTQTDLDLALKAAAASSLGDDLVFVLNGDTYIYHDAAGALNGLVDADDTVVMLTGVTDAKAVVIALGGTPA
jgi:trimeric autotransporter adhesin